MSRQSIRFACIPALALTMALTGCGREEPKYEAKPAVSGLKAELPPVPNVPQKPIKVGDAYTVWGASYYMRNRVHRKDVVDQKLSVTGYIVKTNLLEAPECAVHKGGVADKEGCVAPVPTFWIADSKDAAPEDTMKVMGWASNFAHIFDAIKEYDSGKKDVEVMDSVWGNKLPNPLPAVGAKVTVEGNYGVSFTKASGGAEADPIMGIMTAEDIKVLEPAPELATLPGIKRKEPKP